MTIIYLVTTGEYSDYHIIGAYSNNIMAQLCSAFFNADIEEYELDANIDKVLEKSKPWKVTMERNGNTSDCECLDGWIQEHHDFDNHARFSNDNKINGSYQEVDIYLYAKNEKQAIKSANEKRVQLIANGEWDKYRLDYLVYNFNFFYKRFLPSDKEKADFWLSILKNEYPEEVNIIK